jgi:hypothetical protein
VDHIFFSCVLAKFLWSGVCSILGVDWNPTSFAQFLDIISSLFSLSRHAIWVLFSTQSWALWHIEKFSIENTFPNQSADCVFKSIIFFQQWHPLFRSKDVEVVELLLEILHKLYLDTMVVTSSSSRAQSTIT